MNTYRRTITWRQIAEICRGNADPAADSLGIDAGNGYQSWDSIRTWERYEWIDIDRADWDNECIEHVDPESLLDFDAEDEAHTILHDMLTHVSAEQWVLRAAHDPDVADPQARPSLEHTMVYDLAADRIGIRTTVWRIATVGVVEDLRPAYSVTVWADALTA